MNARQRSLNKIYDALQGKNRPGLSDPLAPLIYPRNLKVRDGPRVSIPLRRIRAKESEVPPFVVVILEGSEDYSADPPYGGSAPLQRWTLECHHSNIADAGTLSDRVQEALARAGFNAYHSSEACIAPNQYAVTVTARIAL